MSDIIQGDTVVQKKTKVVFFFPWREISGGPYYLARIANELAKKHKQYDVYYCDYRYGISYSLITEKNISIIEYEDEYTNFTLFKSEPIILVMPIYWAYRIPVCNSKTRIVFFNWHTECISVLQRDWGCSIKVLSRFLELVKGTSSVFFMDLSHLMAQNEYGVEFKASYVPAVVPYREKKAKAELIRENERNIIVLGRLCWDKIFAILDLIDNIISLRDDVKTNIHIIGEGDNSFRLNRAYPPHIHIKLYGTKEMNKALKIMANKADILFAMGLSVLDGASIGIPSVIIPNDTRPFSCNKYSYVYETIGHILGWKPDQINKIGVRTHSIKEIFDDIYSDGKKEEIGNRCFEYCVNNHISNVGLFISAISDSELEYDTYIDFRKKNKDIIKRIANKVRNSLGNREYTFKILGINIYTRRGLGQFKKNYYLLGVIPFLRIDNSNNCRSIHILILYWIYMFFYDFFVGRMGRMSKMENKTI